MDCTTTSTTTTTIQSACGVGLGKLCSGYEAAKCSATPNLCDLGFGTSYRCDSAYCTYGCNKISQNTGTTVGCAEGQYCYCFFGSPCPVCNSGTCTATGVTQQCFPPTTTTTTTVQTTSKCSDLCNSRGEVVSGYPPQCGSSKPVSECIDNQYLIEWNGYSGTSCNPYTCYCSKKTDCGAGNCNPYTRSCGGSTIPTTTSTVLPYCWDRCAQGGAIRAVCINDNGNPPPQECVWIGEKSGISRWLTARDFQTTSNCYGYCWCENMIECPSGQACDPATVTCKTTTTTSTTTTTISGKCEMFIDQSFCQRDPCCTWDGTACRLKKDGCYQSSDCPVGCSGKKRMSSPSCSAECGCSYGSFVCDKLCGAAAASQADCLSGYTYDPNSCSCTLTSCGRKTCEIESCPSVTAEAGKEFDIKFSYSPGGGSGTKTVSLYSPWGLEKSFSDTGTSCAVSEKTVRVTAPKKPGVYQYEAWCGYSYNDCQVTVRDTTPPEVRTSCPSCMNGNTVTVSWASDSTDVNCTYVQFAECEGNALSGCKNWVNWKNCVGPETTSAPFTGTRGKSYAFRASAVDYAGNKGAWSDYRNAYVMLSSSSFSTYTQNFEGGATRTLDITNQQTVNLKLPKNSIITNSVITISADKSSAPKELSVRIGANELLHYSGKFALDEKGFYGKTDSLKYETINGSFTGLPVSSGSYSPGGSASSFTYGYTPVKPKLKIMPDNRIPAGYAAKSTFGYPLSLLGNPSFEKTNYLEGWTPCSGSSCGVFSGTSGVTDGLKSLGMQKANINSYAFVTSAEIDFSQVSYIGFDVTDDNCVYLKVKAVQGTASYTLYEGCGSGTKIIDAGSIGGYRKLEFTLESNSNYNKPIYIDNIKLYGFPTDTEGIVASPEKTITSTLNSVAYRVYAEKYNIQNPSFESGLAGWNSGGGLYVGTYRATDGSKSLRMYIDSSATSSYISTNVDFSKISYIIFDVSGFSGSNYYLDVYAKGTRIFRSAKAGTKTINVSDISGYGTLLFEMRSSTNEGEAYLDNIRLIGYFPESKEFDLSNIRTYPSSNSISFASDTSLKWEVSDYRGQDFTLNGNLKNAKIRLMRDSLISTNSSGEHGAYSYIIGETGYSGNVDNKAHQHSIIVDGTSYYTEPNSWTHTDSCSYTQESTYFGRVACIDTGEHRETISIPINGISYVFTSLPSGMHDHDDSVLVNCNSNGCGAVGCGRTGSCCVSAYNPSYTSSFSSSPCTGDSAHTHNFILPPINNPVITINGQKFYASNGRVDTRGYIEISLPDGIINRGYNNITISPEKQEGYTIAYEISGNLYSENPYPAGTTQQVNGYASSADITLYGSRLSADVTADRDASGSFMIKDSSHQNNIIKSAFNFDAMTMGGKCNLNLMADSYVFYDGRHGAEWCRCGCSNSDGTCADTVQPVSSPDCSSYAFNKKSFSINPAYINDGVMTSSLGYTGTWTQDCGGPGYCENIPIKSYYNPSLVYTVAIPTKNAKVSINSNQIISGINLEDKPGNMKQASTTNSITLNKGTNTLSFSTTEMTNFLEDTKADGDGSGRFAWKITGSMSQELDISSELSRYLQACTPDASGYCTVPLTFSSMGSTITVSGLTVTYTTSDVCKVLETTTTTVATTTTSTSTTVPTTSTSTTTTTRTTTTSTTSTTTCFDPILSAPVVSPANPYAGNTFQIYCPTGYTQSAGINCVHAYANGASSRCEYYTWSGNSIVFNCNDISRGSYSAVCKSVTIAEDASATKGCCSTTRTTVYTVVTTTTTVPTTTLTSTTVCKNYVCGDSVGLAGHTMILSSSGAYVIDGCRYNNNGYCTYGCNPSTGLCYLSPTSTSTTTTCINALTGSPSLNPGNPFVNTGYQILCPGSSNTLQCLNAYADGVQCNWAGLSGTGWSGNNAIFNCQGTSVGNHQAKCEAVTGSPSYCCASFSERTYTVVTTTSTTAKTTTSTSVSTTTSTTLPCTDALTGNPTFTPSSSPLAGNSFYINCPVSSTSLTCVKAYANDYSDSCALWASGTGYLGFLCTMYTPGNYVARCAAVYDSSTQCCSETFTSTYTVRTTTTTVSCSSLSLTPASGGTGYDVNADVSDNSCRICTTGCSGANCAGTIVRTGDGSFTAPTVPGTYTYYSCPGAGSASISVTTTVRDTTKPVISSVTVKEVNSPQYQHSDGSTIWYNNANPSNSGSFVIIPSASDSGSGVSGVSYPPTISYGGTNSTSPYSWTYVWDSYDTYSSPTSITVADKASNQNTYPISILRDITAPQTNPTTVVTTTNGWSNSDMTITFVCSDGTGSGCNKTFISVVEASQTCGTYTVSNTYTITSQASQSSTKKICYYSNDNVNNTEAAKSTVFGVDKVNPSVTGIAVQELSGQGFQHSQGNNVWFNPSGSGSFRITPSAADSHSGLNKTEYPKTISNGGTNYTSPFSWVYSFDSGNNVNHNFQITVYDNAGNSVSYPVNFVKDDTAPTTSISTDSSWKSNSVTAYLTCSDPGSGCNKTYYCVAQGSSACTTYTESNAGSVPVAISCDPNTVCTRTVYYYSTDNVGNKEIAKSTPINIDTAKPSGVLISPCSNCAFESVADIFNVNGTATDGSGSGLAANSVKYYIKNSSGYYRTVDGTWELAEKWLGTYLTPYAGQYIFVNSTSLIANKNWPVGRYSIAIKVTDSAGNIFISQPSYFDITGILPPANNPPVITESYVSAAPDPADINGTVNFTARVTDPDWDKDRTNMVDKVFVCDNPSCTGRVYCKMSTSDGEIFNCSFSDLELLGIGQKNYYIWANDTRGATSSSILHTFNVTDISIGDISMSGNSAQIGISGSNIRYMPENRYVTDASARCTAGSKSCVTPVLSGQFSGCMIPTPGSGSMQITCVVTDSQGRDGTKTKIFTVPTTTTTVPDTTKPVVNTITVTETSGSEYEHYQASSNDVTIWINPGTTGNQHSGGFTVVVTTTDAQSGVSKVEFPSITSTTFISDTSTPYENPYSWNPSVTTDTNSQIKVTDNAGNTQTVPFIVLIDNTAPVTSISPPPPEWTTTDFTFTLTCYDARSGCAAMSYSVVAENAVCGTQTQVASGFTRTMSCPSGTCTWKICYNSTDNVGNREALNEKYIRIDKSVPTISLTSPSSGTYFNSDMVPRVAGNVLDSTGSGIAANSVQFYIRNSATGQYKTETGWTSSQYWLKTTHAASNGNQVSFTNSSDISNVLWGSGTYTIRARVYDAAGNSALSNEITVTIQSSSPTTSTTTSTSTTTTARTTTTSTSTTTAPTTTTTMANRPPLIENVVASPNTVRQDGTVTFSARVTDPDWVPGGDNSVSYVRVCDNTACSGRVFCNTMTPDSGYTQWTCSYSDLETMTTGQKTFYIVAVDTKGATSSASGTFTITAPTTTTSTSTVTTTISTTTTSSTTTVPTTTSTTISPNVMCAGVHFTEYVNPAWQHANDTIGKIWYNNKSTGTFRIEPVSGSGVTLTSVEFPTVFTSSDGQTISSSPFTKSYSWITTSSFSGQRIMVLRSGTSTANCPFNVSLDNTNPLTTISPSYTNWVTQNPMFSLSCSDQGITDSRSGCNQTFYSIVDSSASCGAYTPSSAGSVVCNDNDACNKTICYYSNDNVNNIEAVKRSGEFLVDKALPAFTVTEPVNGRTYYPSGVPVRVSGMVNDTKGSGLPANSVQFYLRNPAGQYWNGNSWTSSQVYLTAASSTAPAGINILFTSSQMPASSSFGAGQYTLGLRASDIAGNIQSSQITFSVSGEDPIVIEEPEARGYHWPEPADIDEYVEFFANARGGSGISTVRACNTSDCSQKVYCTLGKDALKGENYYGCRVQDSNLETIGLGQRDYYIVARDTKGNSAYTSMRTFTLRNITIGSFTASGNTSIISYSASGIRYQDTGALLSSGTGMLTSGKKTYTNQISSGSIIGEKKIENPALTVKGYNYMTFTALDNPPVSMPPISGFVRASVNLNGTFSEMKVATTKLYDKERGYSVGRNERIILNLKDVINNGNLDWVNGDVRFVANYSSAGSPETSVFCESAVNIKAGDLPFTPECMNTFADKGTYLITGYLVYFGHSATIILGSSEPKMFEVEGGGGAPEVKAIDLTANVYFPGLETGMAVNCTDSLCDANFTRGQPVEFNAEAFYWTSSENSIRCDGSSLSDPSDFCTAKYIIDGNEEKTMTWKATHWEVSEDSSLLGCYQMHDITVTFRKEMLSEIVSKKFYISCDPAVRVIPKTARIPLGSSNVTVFNVTIINPLDNPRTFSLRMDDPKAMAINWLRWMEGGNPVDGLELTSRQVSGMGQSSFLVRIDYAGRSVSSDIYFTATDTDRKTYKERGMLMVYDKGLSEFSPLWMAVLMMSGAMIFAARVKKP